MNFHWMMPLLKISLMLIKSVKILFFFFFFKLHLSSSKSWCLKPVCTEVKCHRALVLPVLNNSKDYEDSVPLACELLWMFPICKVCWVKHLLSQLGSPKWNCFFFFLGSCTIALPTIVCHVSVFQIWSSAVNLNMMIYHFSLFIFPVKSILLRHWFTYYIQFWTVLSCNMCTTLFSFTISIFYCFMLLYLEKITENNLFQFKITQG